jgi:hypothetical protein
MSGVSFPSRKFVKAINYERRRCAVSGPTKKITIQFSAEAVEALEKFQAQYPIRSTSEFTNAAVLYLAKQAWVTGLNADLEPIGAVLTEDLVRDIVAKEVAACYANEDNENPLGLTLV